MCRDVRFSIGHLQMCSHGFLGGQVVDKGSADGNPTVGFWSAAGARASRLNWTEIRREGRVFEVEHAGRGYGIAKALGMAIRKHCPRKDAVSVHIRQSA